MQTLSNFSVPGLPHGVAGIVTLALIFTLWGLRKLPQLKYSFLHSTWWHVASSAATAGIGLVLPVIQKSGLDANAIVSALVMGVFAYLGQDNPAASSMPAVNAALLSTRASKPSLADDVTSKGPKIVNFIPFLFGAWFICTTLVACPQGVTPGQVGKDILANCGGEVAVSAESLLGQVGAILIAGGPNVQQSLDDLATSQGITTGIDVVGCAVKTWIADLINRAKGTALSVMAQNGISEGQKFLARHGVK